MPFDLKNLNPPQRFFWPGDRMGEEWVELRIMTDADQLTLIKEVGIDRKQAFKVNPLTKQMERLEYVDTDLDKGETFAYRVFDFVIVNWNLKAPDGKEIKCITENKTLLMTQSNDFRQWVDECLGKMKLEREKHSEELRKNSLGSQ